MPMPPKRTPRVLFVSNSQGTAAGLEGDRRWSNYPLVVQEMLPDVDCRYWMVSELSLFTVDDLFREIVMPHRPDVAVLQTGIIECALRILPRNLRDLLRIVPGGRIITKAIHDRQASWRRMTARLGFRFLDVPLPAYLAHLRSIHGKCASLGIRPVVVRIPPLSASCERDVLPGTNRVIEEYNAAVDELLRTLGTTALDPFAGASDPSRESLFLPGTVHFSEAGHRLIAANVAGFLESCLDRR